MLLFASCAPDQEMAQENVVEVQTIEELSSLSGIDIKIPSTARNTSFSIINSIIAKADYSYNSVLFTHRASKLSSGETLSGITIKASRESKLTFDDRAEITVIDYPSGAREAVWYVNGTYNSLYSEKSISDDLITEICDLII